MGKIFYASLRTGGNHLPGSRRARACAKLTVLRDGVEWPVLFLPTIGCSRYKKRVGAKPRRLAAARAGSGHETRSGSCPARRVTSTIKVEWLDDERVVYTRFPRRTTADLGRVGGPDRRPSGAHPASFLPESRNRPWSFAEARGGGEMSRIRNGPPCAVCCLGSLPWPAGAQQPRQAQILGAGRARPNGHRRVTADHMSVQAGETVKFMVSSQAPRYRAEDRPDDPRPMRTRKARASKRRSSTRRPTLSTCPSVRRCRWAHT